MMKSTAHRLVERFVQSVNAQPREQLRVDEVPKPCRSAIASSYGEDLCDWKIVPCPEPAWLPDLETKATLRSPQAFRRLVGGLASVHALTRIRELRRYDELE